MALWTSQQAVENGKGSFTCGVPSHEHKLVFLIRNGRSIIGCMPEGPNSIHLIAIIDENRSEIDFDLQEAGRLALVRDQERSKGVEVDR